MKNRVTANALLSLQEGERVVTGEMCEMCQRQISHSVKHGPKTPKLTAGNLTLNVFGMLSAFSCLTLQRRKPLPKSLCLLCLFLQVPWWRIGPQSLYTSGRSLDQFSLAEPTSESLEMVVLTMNLEP